MAPDKKILRKTVKDRLKGLTREEIDRHSQVICERILGSAAWKDSPSIALFASLATEPQLQRLAEVAWAEGRIVAFPHVDSTDSQLFFHRVGSYSELQSRTHGILEPRIADASTLVNPSSLNLICVPGVAFDRRGARLGRGAGWFDRAILSRDHFEPATCRMGVFFSVQEIPEVPEMPHDVRMDAIVTEQELFLL